MSKTDDFPVQVSVRALNTGRQSDPLVEAFLKYWGEKVREGGNVFAGRR